MSDPEIRHADPREGFDNTEPRAGAIVAFAVGSVLLLILTIIRYWAYIPWSAR